LIEYVLDWRGPFHWFTGDGPVLSQHPDASLGGVYMLTFEYRDGYLIHFAGITQKSFASRFLDHTKEFLSGVYAILDPEQVMSGLRVERWPGVWYGKEPWPRFDEFLRRYNEISPHIGALLRSYRLFIAPLAAEKRVLARIEAAIMNLLYAAPEPVSTIPDRGMSLSPRWPVELPFRVRTATPVRLHGLPVEFEA